ncbi:ABC transporter ATP-binding protein [Paenibacillus riograndensis]|uniref:Bacitracin transport ATP-binding protein BcrA n=1 Tax=Paenibacillus riograndensis SBR5 TaxID=1073571 RepID=A0A0E4CYS6_9BACL|nr:ABC transporter ATP-binding protein [Paenibacillus riograndensis]CQR57824.1 Bacitracin transport ATP-binding protein BcrA [Paenibacillus riograndensis SBR5]
MNAYPIIETQHLTKSYGGTPRVDHINLAVQQGEIFGFLGPNGAGKTTTLKMLLGLIQPTKGSVKLFGKELRNNRESILNQTGSLIESPSYYGHLTGLENLRVMQRLRSLPAKNIDKVLQIVRLDNHKHKPARQYSLGMKQRLGLAMALLAFPSLLILDEPTNGLDPAGIGEIRELIQSLPAQYGMTILVSSHLLSEIEQIATSVGIISEGKLLFQGTMAALQAQNQAAIHFQTHDPAMAVKVLAAHGYRPRIQERLLVFGAMQDSEVARINEILVSSRISVSRIEAYKKSLEDIFLDLTGKERSL